MTTKALGALLLLLAPAGMTYVAGFNEAAHYLALGSVLALQLGVLARPVAAFAVLIPAVYAAAAITAQSTDGVVALIVAMAAAVGAASSQGLNRGLMALLVAALLGSFEPASSGEVLWRAAYLLAGSSYGFVLSVTALRHVSIEAPHVHPQSALGYAVLLALLTLVAWFGARLAGLANPWWLPLVIVAVSEPKQDGSMRHALVRVALAATAAMVLILVIDLFEAPAVRGVLLVAALLVAFSAGPRNPTLFGVLIAPVLVLVSSHAAIHATSLEFLGATLPIFVPLLAVSTLGHWLFWTLRSGSGRVIA